MKATPIKFTVFEKKLIAKAKRNKKRIIFPEAYDSRVREAIRYLIKNNIVDPVIIGDKNKLTKYCKQHKITPEIINAKCSILQKRCISTLMQKRKNKGMTQKLAKQLIKDPIYPATHLVLKKKVYGLVSGASHPTSHTLRPAIQILGTKKGFKKISSHFVMTKGKEIYLFADCGVQINPNAKELAEITSLAIESARSYGIKPKVALLSFSTKGSAEHEFVTKVQKATKIAKTKNKKTPIEGEFQFDAAFVPHIRKLKAPKSTLKGQPNVFIFPDLQSGNICYKVVQHMSNFDAIGPIVQGLSKPVNDLSRGCNVKEVILAAVITALQ